MALENHLLSAPRARLQMGWTIPDLKTKIREFPGDLDF